MGLEKESQQPGRQVRLVNNPLRIGMLTGKKPIERNGRRLVQVRFPDRVEQVYEDTLESQPEERMNPLDLLEEGKLGTPQDLRRTLTHVRLTGRLADIIYSMESTNTDFHAYQFKPVLKLLQTPTNSLLIADEVGLGKTIEAGLIWTELRSRFNLNRLLVLCPAALQEKWKNELVDKMGVSPDICNAGETLKLLEDNEKQAKGFAVIASIQGLRPPRKWEDDERESASAKLARFLRSKESEERLVDLVVIDEAHHMRNPETQGNVLGQLLRSVCEYFVLLTATPIHNYNEDLFSLLRLLDPDTFDRKESFEEILEANAPLVQARDIVLAGSSDSKRLTELLAAAKNTRLLKGNRQIQILLKEITDDKSASIPDRSYMAYRLETANLLGHVVTRTRKRDVNEWRVIRDPKAEFVPMTEVEQRFYDTVTEIVIDYSEKRGISEAFLLATPQRQMTSCMPAALKSWKTRQPDLPEEESSWAGQTAAQESQLGPLTTELVARVGELGRLDDLIESDSKYKRLREMLREHFKRHPKDKIVIFATFRGTLAYLYDRLDEDGISSLILQGGGTRTKDEIIREFGSPGGPSLLLSSEVGSEGVDLQFSWIVINYDLPWNPMRVEQRIGRIDRLGQKAEKVEIRNLFYADTIDARIYERLYDKLDLCRSALGDFEAILGEKIEALTKDLLTNRLTPQQQEERITQTAQALENLKQEGERLESEAVHLVAYGDYILQQIRAARDMNRWINGDDLLGYVRDFLNIRYPGHDLSEIDEGKHEYNLSLTVAAKHALNEFMRQRNLLGQTRLIQNISTPVPCRFENRVLPKTRSRIEIISQFHPLVRFISEEVSATVSQIRPAVALKIPVQNCPGFDTGIYVLAVSLWSVQGIRNVEKLVSEVVHTAAPDHLLGGDKAENLANVCASKGKPWLEARRQCDLSFVHEIANGKLFGVLDKRFERFVEEEKAQNEDRADIQLRNLDRYISRQSETIRRTIENLRASGRTKLIPANEGRLAALKDRCERQTMDINSRRQVKSTLDDICVVVARVE